MAVVDTVDGGSGSIFAQDASVSPPAAADGGSTLASLTGEQTAEYRRMFSEATAAYGRNDFTAAARLFRAMYDRRPDAAIAYNLARVYERIGEVSEAVGFFERVLAATPPPSEAQRQDIAQRIAALRAYEQRRSAGFAQPPATAAELNQEGLTWFQRGVRFFQRGQYAQALQAFEEAARFLQTPELLFNLATTYERMRNIPRAVEYYRQFAESRRGTAEEDFVARHIQELESR